MLISDKHYARGSMVLCLFMAGRLYIGFSIVFNKSRIGRDIVQRVCTIGFIINSIRIIGECACVVGQLKRV